MAKELKDAFNSTYDYRTSRASEVVLCVYYGSVCHYYDFAARVLTTLDTNKGGAATLPFSQLDRESLEAMRDQLAKIGGNPPALPPPDDAAPTLLKSSLRAKP